MSDRSDRPRVTISYAQTLDGKLATRTGQSQWIGGGASVQFAHQLRAEHDAIMVGVGTVITDNPRLTVRLVTGRDPLRVVVDSTLRLPLNAAVVTGGAAHGTLIATTERAGSDQISRLRERGAMVLVLPTNDLQQVDLWALLRVLWERGVRSIMVEGGAALITALFQAQLVDRVAICVAPKIMGAGLAAVGDLGITALADLITLDQVALQQYGPDWIVTGDVIYPARGDRAAS